MTAQEIYDTVARGLLAQGKPSVNSDSKCLYRGPGGVKCALGMLISDEIYTPKFEDYSYKNLIENDKIGLGGDYWNHLGLLRKLQRAHDSDSDSLSDKEWLQSWKDRMLSVAKDFNLDASVFENGSKP